MLEFFQKKHLVIYWLLALTISCIYSIQGPGDFHIFMQASHDAINGIDVYSKMYNQWYHYYYGLSFAIAIYPLTFLPFKVAAFIWLMFNFYFLLECIKRLVECLKIKRNDSLALLIFIAAFCLQFILQNLRYGQMTILVLFSVLQSVKFLLDKQYWKAGLLLGFGIHVKLLPLVILPWMIYRKEWRGIFYTCSFLALFYLAPILIMGKASYQENMKTWYALINPSNQKHVLDTDERSFHGLSTLLATLLVENVPDDHALPIKRNIVSIQAEKLNGILNIVRLIFIGSVILVFKWPPFKKLSDSYQAFKEVSYLLCLIPLIFPHQQHYAFLLCWPSAMFLLVSEWRLNGNSFTFTKAFLVLILLVFNLSLFIGHYTDYYEHFKIITYAAILLLALFAFQSNKLLAKSF